MALRTAQTLLGTFIRAGVFSLVGAAESCIAHGLGATPDSIVFSPIHPGAVAAGTSLVVGITLQSWDATSMVFVNSTQSRAIYLRAAVEHSIVS